MNNREAEARSEDFKIKYGIIDEGDIVSMDDLQETEEIDYDE